MRQIEVKALLRQMVLGIRAGLLRFSCRATQKTKAGIRARERAKRLMLAG